jgi:cobalt-precorrin 5A hydrolase
MIVAGIGCRRGASADAVLAAVHGALAQVGIGEARLDALATAADKRSETGIAAAAELLALRLLFISPTHMEAVSGRALTASARVEALKGVPSVAETAALAAAGRGARLLAARLAMPTVTCAIAEGDGP